MMLVPCSECGEQHYRLRVGEVNYCSDKCKMRVYRRNKAQKQAAERMTMTLEEFGCYSAVQEIVRHEETGAAILQLLGMSPRNMWLGTLEVIGLVAEHAALQSDKSNHAPTDVDA